MSSRVEHIKKVVFRIKHFVEKNSQNYDVSRGDEVPDVVYALEEISEALYLIVGHLEAEEKKWEIP